MRRMFLLLLFCLPKLMNAQAKVNATGIQFEEQLSWEGIKAKANRDGKYIFVDAYASWCVPCKKMDKEIYSLQNIGGFFNDQFVSVKVQFDTSKNDDDRIKNWYAVSHLLQEQFS